MALPAKTSVSQDGIVAPHLFRYDWDSDITESNTFRPGTIFGYSVTLAAPDGPATAYLRLCADSSAGAYQYWGGVIEVKVCSPKFVPFPVASRMTDRFDLNGVAGAGVGIHVANSGTTGTLYVDALSEVTVIRPKLSISDTAPIDLGTVRRGVANVKLTLEWGVGHAWDATDHVGAKILGGDAAHFEFVSEHRGSSPQELKLVGADKQGGLLGGPNPESEELVVKFTGSNEPGT